MSLRISANRYARALFDVALEEKGDLAQVDRDLTAVVELLASNAELNGVAMRPGIPEQMRKAMITAVADKMGLLVPVKKVLALLAETPTRWPIVGPGRR